MIRTQPGAMCGMMLTLIGLKSATPTQFYHVCASLEKIFIKSTQILTKLLGNNNASYPRPSASHAMVKSAGASTLCRMP